MGASKTDALFFIPLEVENSCMKRIIFFGNRFLLMIVFLIPLNMMAQEIRAVRTERIARSIKGELTASAISPDGTRILITGEGFKGLYLLDLRDGKTTPVCSDAGAGYKPVFSANGNKIWYRSDDFSGMMKYSSLVEYDIPAAKTRIIESKTRNLSPPQVVNEHPVYSVDGKQKSDPDAPKSADGTIYTVLEELVPVIYINGIGKTVKPNGEGNYIWASLSPDKTKLLYNYGGRSTFVCDLDGRILAEAGRIDAPEWLNNSMIVGMNDKDDGYRVLSSDIICYSLTTGKTTNLTNSDETIEMYPLPFPDGERLVYKTLNGELYIMHIRVK
jgi:Tol biopolymer transport system component